MRVLSMGSSVDSTQPRRIHELEDKSIEITPPKTLREESENKIKQNRTFKSCGTRSKVLIYW